MTDSQSRGSEELLRTYRAGGLTVHHDFVKSLFEIVPEREFTQVLTKGIPVPIWLHATFAAGSPGEAPATIGRILDLISQSRVAAELRLFPKGIPWPEEFLATITINEHMSH